MEESALTLGVTSNYVTYDSTETLISDAGQQNGGLKNYGGVMQQEENADNGNNLGFRLRRRKEVLSQRKCIVDISFVLGLLGIVLTIIDTELIFNEVTTANSGLSTALRILTSVTTGGLLLAILAYHVVGLRLYMASAGFSDWRLAMTSTKWMKLLFELFVCMIHPLPFLDIPVSTVSVTQENNNLKSSTIPINGILTILMFLRLYLFGRFIVVHSKLFLDTSVQSLGALSRVRINAQFVFRALMSTMPGVVLTTVMLGTFFINSWNLRVCEMYTNPEGDDLSTFTQAMWLTAVTFLTVGYGDLIPHSYCGRLIAGWTGLMGVGIMALSVAVLAKHLEQSRSEKYVHTFVQQISLDKTRKHAAANVIKYMIRIYKMKKAKLTERSAGMLVYRSKLLKAIRTMHEAQFDKRHLQECTVGPVELSTGMNDMQGSIRAVQDEQKALGARVATIEALALNMNAQLLEMKDILMKKKMF